MNPSSVSRSERVRAVANWINLSTPLGMLAARLGGARMYRTTNGLWLAEGYRFGFPAGAAFTVGSVVITRDQTLNELLLTHPDLWIHESRHASQWALCLGLPFLPLYLLANAWSWLRTGTMHSENFFEVRAGLEIGGYQRVPPRKFRR